MGIIGSHVDLTSGGRDIKRCVQNRLALDALLAAPEPKAREVALYK
jgi:hypothetical protein